MDRLGRIPGEEEHPQVVHENVTFTVMETEDRRIERVHAEVVPPPPEEETGTTDKPDKPDKEKKSREEK